MAKETRNEGHVYIIYAYTFVCYMHVCVLSCLAVSDSLRPHGLYSPPSSSVHGISQARILE